MGRRDGGMLVIRWFSFDEPNLFVVGIGYYTIIRSVVNWIVNDRLQKLRITVTYAITSKPNYFEVCDSVHSE